jgi:hypothetical protein
MSMTYELDKKERVVRILGSGRLTDEELVECIASLRADPELEPDMHTLSDLRNIDVAFTSDGVSSMLSVMKNSSAERSEAKAAIVVSSDIAFGMGRMVELRSEDEIDPSFKIFRDMTAAQAWLRNA